MTFISAKFNSKAWLKRPRITPENWRESHDDDDDDDDNNNDNNDNNNNDDDY